MAAAIDAGPAEDLAAVAAETAADAGPADDAATSPGRTAAALAVVAAGTPGCRGTVPVPTGGRVLDKDDDDDGRGFLTGSPPAIIYWTESTTRPQFLSGRRYLCD